MNSSPSGRIFRQLSEPNFTDYLGNTTFATEPECAPLQDSFILAVAMAPAIVMVENVIFLVSVLMYRRILKHNNVYTYVTSFLAANILTSLSAFYHFLNYYVGIESKDPNPWWAFRKGMTAGFSLILCGNIGLLIYAIEDCTYVVGRLAPMPRNNKKLNPKTRMHMAAFRISIAWVLPILYGMVAMTQLSCTNTCTCTLHYKSDEPICPEKHCSRLYTPMSKIYLLVIVLLWAIECSVLFILLCRSAVLAVRESTPARTKAGVKTPSVMKCIMCSQIPSSHTFLLLLLAMFVICTGPVMILILIDWAQPQITMDPLLVNLVVPLPLIYCLISPILLTRRLSGIKSALLMTLTCSWLTGKRKTRETNNIVRKRRRATDDFCSSRDDSCEVV